MDQKFEFFSDDYVFENGLPPSSDDVRELIVRLDKWLWAARFFKTRAVARLAVEKGKVFYNGERAKPSRAIELGATLIIQQGRCQKTVIIRGLSTRRRGTEESIQLFEETEESRLNREQAPVFQSDYTQHQSPFQPQSFYPSTPTERTGNYNYNTAQGEQPRERRVIRFLRRPFNKSEPRTPRTATPYPNHSKVDIENLD
ncbi:MAG TPA: S4 domain-containing protein [Gammaproteobacteria bacterium]|nr:S4 domain-containing protein [Gammaproteobacteria bacterium]